MLGSIASRNNDRGGMLLYSQRSTPNVPAPTLTPSTTVLTETHIQLLDSSQLVPFSLFAKTHFFGEDKAVATRYNAIRTEVEQRTGSTNVTAIKTKGCGKIKNIVSQAATFFSDISEVISYRRFYLICVPTEAFSVKEVRAQAQGINAETSESHAVASASALENGDIILEASVNSSDEFNLITAHHELIHAKHMLHHLKKCKSSLPYPSAAPIFPVSEKEINKYNAALDKGDKRIRSFAKLYLDKANNKTLSNQQEVLYQRYLKACSGCPIIPVVAAIRSETFQDLLGHGFKENEINNDVEVKIQTEDYGNVFIKRIYRKGDALRAEILPTSAAASIAKLPDKVASILKTQTEVRRASYGKSILEKTDPHNLLEEREAYTFQQLTDDAAKELYPEAYVLREKYLKECQSSSDSAEELPKDSILNLS